MIPVAPLVGAWIEIQKVKPSEEEYIVAPLVGAWIEMAQIGSKNQQTIVAPLVGAWIEIKVTVLDSEWNSSRSSRGSVD